MDVVSKIAYQISVNFHYRTRMQDTAATHVTCVHSSAQQGLLAHVGRIIAHFRDAGTLCITKFCDRPLPDFEVGPALL
jgi:hypothetical protein